MEQEQEVVTEVETRFIWRRGFTIVLILNAIYIVLFYYLMQSYT